MKNHGLQGQAEQFKGGLVVCFFFLSICRLVGSKEHAAATELEPHELPSPESQDAEGFCLPQKVQALLPAYPMSLGSPAQSFFPRPLCGRKALKKPKFQPPNYKTQTEAASMPE